MYYDLISKMSLGELKKYLRIRGLKVNGRKHELVARVFAASENGVKPVKTAVKVEADLKTEHLAKLNLAKLTIGIYQILKLNMTSRYSTIDTLCLL